MNRFLADCAFARPKRACLGVVLGSILLASCSRSNNLLLGRVEAVVGNHTVVVTDCYRTRVPVPWAFSDGTSRFVPCRDAEVVIRRDELVVNGRSYGRLKANDAVLVDHGVVSITSNAPR